MQGKSKLFGSIIALLVIIVAVLYMAGSFSNKQAAGNKPVLATTYEGKVATVELTAIKRSEDVPGTVIAKQNTQISSRVMAQVERLNVRAGDSVVQGDVLITLQQDDFKAQLAQSDAQIKAIQASLTQADKQLKRVTELYSQGLVSVSDNDEAKAKFDNLTASLAVAKQQQTQAQVALEFTRIKAPISGVVVERLVEPGDTAVPGSPLLALYNPQQLQFEFNVRERQAISLTLGQSLTVSLPSLNITAVAVVSEIVPIADSAARSMLIRLELPTQSNLMPGLYAQLHLPLDTEQGILIEPSWVHEYGQLAMVYVINEQKIERRFVRLGEVINAKQHIIAGLNAGDTLAVDFKPK
ncbi:MAG: efflux RND transporter periplasmic adaptor subunit [Pseudoalteromonas prydzensis]|uniref:Efflux RND transporter periplasmic adaptor subunit n=2 Tax=root TaxID=1 RepID=A0A7V1GF68_9GAMM|nr:efflux RND transporter periplasmic adaptor subunit [Pseudoalteromonas prydzensis]HEA17047.1 efflux RND transporter periplasmic adaptor subunit [Pseudoalteromonas prydzensis]